MVYVACGMHYVYLLRGHYDIGVNRVQLLARLSLVSMVLTLLLISQFLWGKMTIGTSVHQKSRVIIGGNTRLLTKR
jgi:hypothetical protein